MKHLTAPRPFDSRLRDGNQPYLRANAHAADTPPCREVGFILLEHFSMMAFTGAVDALVTANLLSTAPLYRASTFALTGPSVLSDLGIAISVDARLTDLETHKLDLLIVCGGYRSATAPSRPLLDALRGAARRTPRLGGLWNGCYALAQAGLLDGYACTVHPESRAGLVEAHPAVHVLPLPYVIDRDRLSCAGAHSALGMMLALIRAQHGDEVARGVEAILTCDRSRDLPDRPLSTFANDPALPAALRIALELMERNLEEPLDLIELARHAQVSRRQLDRLFQQHIHATPARYYLELRITHARRLLLHTSEPVTRIAIACGFRSGAHFSRCYREFFSQTPLQTRQSRPGT